MRGLLLKDYYSIGIKKLLLFLFALAPHWAVISRINLKDPVEVFYAADINYYVFDGFQNAAVLCAIVGMYLLISAIDADERSGFIKQAFVSPSGRKKYMAGKYIFGLLCTFIPLLLNILITIVIMSCYGIPVTEYSDYSDKIFEFTIVVMLVTILWVMLIVSIGMIVNLRVAEFASLILFVIRFIVLGVYTSIPDFLKIVIRAGFAVITFGLFVMGWFSIRRREE